MKKLLAIFIFITIFAFGQENYFDAAHMQVHGSLIGSTNLNGFDVSYGDIGFLAGFGTKFDRANFYIGATGGYIQFYDADFGIPVLVEGRLYAGDHFFITLAPGILLEHDRAISQVIGESRYGVKFNGLAGVGYEPLRNISVSGQGGIYLVSDQLKVWFALGF